jgi:hypothetical protein
VCDLEAEGWIAGPAPTRRPFSVHVADCQPPEAGKPEPLRSFNARWHFQVPRLGVYSIRTWIPDQNNACSLGPEGYNTALQYNLVGPGTSTSTTIDQRAHAAGPAFLWPQVELNEGEHTILLSDCAEAPLAPDERVWADTLFVIFLR